MLEATESLLPILFQKERIQVLCIGFEENSMDELSRLLETLGAATLERIMASMRTIHPGTFLGKGKIETIRQRAEELKADAIIVDVELSPNQLKNLEKSLRIPILDRPGVIIEIFSRHARSREAKTQVALARLQYLLPRLAHFWTHFERQRGGAPGSRGMGEKQFEVDRRLVKSRISLLRTRLADIEKERTVQRAGRKKILKVALVGYTNAGKSTLLNALTHSKVRAEDKLFATLDASVRTLDPNSHPPVVAIDTVGFISHLPPSLIASFRSTLEELEEADLLVHVIDASHPQAREQYEVTEKVLMELGVSEKPTIPVLNKADCVKGVAEKNRAKLICPGASFISALNPQEVVRLRDLILNHFRKNLELWEVLIPYEESRLEAMIYAHGSVEVTRSSEKGLFFKVRIDDEWAKKLGLEKSRL